jgi:hypothetical protein
MEQTKAVARIVFSITLVAAVLAVAPILLQVPLVTEAKVSMQADLRYSGPRASIAVSGSSNVYLTWWDNKTGNNEVFFAGSNDAGKTFGKPINLSNAKGGSADSQIAASGKNVYVTWWDNKTGNWQVFSKASTDNGKTFGNDAVVIKSVGKTPVKKLTPTPSSTIPVDTIVAAPSGSSNNEYVVWWDNTTGNWDVYFAKSTDNGKTFGSPINISNSPDSRSLGARIATQGNNNVYIAWIDIKSGQKQVMFRSSTDSGNTFGNPVMVNDNSTISK